MGLLALLAYGIVVILLMAGAVWLFNAALRRLVGDKHRAIQHIFETGTVPSSWRRRGAAAAVHVRRLDRLIRYAGRSRLIDGDDSRKLLLGRLRKAREDWMR